MGLRTVPDSECASSPRRPELDSEDNAKRPERFEVTPNIAMRPRDLEMKASCKFRRSTQLCGTRGRYQGHSLSAV